MLKKIIAEIENSGGKVYLVGGYVRDKIMGNTSKDIDIEVFKLSYEKLSDILSKFGKVDLVGKSFGVLKVNINGQDYDFNLPRRDSKNGVGHKDFTIEVDHNMTIEEAASRRDFTINAISIDSEGNIIDPFNGLNDIKNNVLRPVSKAFKQDVLRPLRGFQFSARFNMNPTVGCILDSVELMDGYKYLPKERIWEEWKKWASKGEYFRTSLRFLKNTYWKRLYPELNAIFGVEQDKVFHPEGTVDIHTGYVLEEMFKNCRHLNITGDDKLVLIFAALCHDFGKANTTEKRFSEKHNREIISAIGHEKAGGPLTESFLNSIGCPKNIIERVIPLVENHMVACQKLSDNAIRRLSNRLGKATIEELCLLIMSDHNGRPPIEKGISENLWYLIIRSTKLGLLNGKPESIVKGQDIVDFGFEPGPIVGKIYKKLYNMQLNGKFFNKEDGLSRIESFIGQL